jgi:hypothetical protein
MDLESRFAPAVHIEYHIEPAISRTTSDRPLTTRAILSKSMISGVSNGVWY